MSHKFLNVVTKKSQWDELSKLLGWAQGQTGWEDVAAALDYEKTEILRIRSSKEDKVEALFLDWQYRRGATCENLIKAFDSVRLHHASQMVKKWIHEKDPSYPYNEGK